MKKPKITNINFSFLAIFKVVLVLLILVFLYFIRDILAVIFISLIFASAVDPWVDKLQKIKIPRSVTILFIFIILLVVVGSVVTILIPPIVEQVTQLTTEFPTYYQKLVDSFSYLQDYSDTHGISENFEKSVTFFEEKVTTAISGLFSKVGGVVAGIVSFFLVLVITFYMTVEESAIKRSLKFIVPKRQQNFVAEVVDKAQRKIGSWLTGQLILCLIVGVLAYLGLLILGVDYALVLGIFAGIGELVPYAGPVISAVPAVLLALAQSPVKAIFVVILYFVIQQLENHVLVPKVMQKAVGLNPIISILALMVGAKIGGVVGMILAIPVATAISVVIQEVWKDKEEVTDLLHTKVKEKYYDK